MSTRAGAQTWGPATAATAAVAGLQLAWLYALLHIVNQGLQLGLAVPWILVAYAAAVALGLGLRAAGCSQRAGRVISGLVWPPTALVMLMILLYPGGGAAGDSWAGAMLLAFDGISGAVAAAIYVVGASGVLWWFGTRLTTCPMTHAAVLAEFQFGLMVLAGSLFFGYLAGVDVSATTPLAVVFVGFGLMGAAAARVDEERSPLSLGQGGTWWGMLLAGVGLVLLLGLLAGILFTPELMHLVARGVRAVAGLVGRLISAIAGLFPSSGSEEVALPPPGEISPPPTDDGSGFSLALPDWLRGPSQIVWGVAFGALILVAVWRVSSQLLASLRRKADRGGVQIESLPGAFRLNIVTLFRRILKRLSGLFGLGRLRRRAREDPAETASVRSLYADMLRWGARSGFPRGSSQTPFEYQRMLCAALPAHSADVIFITDSYVGVRYGARPPTETDLRRLRESRRRLKRRPDRRGGRTAGRLSDEA